MTREDLYRSFGGYEMTNRDKLIAACSSFTYGYTEDGEKVIFNDTDTREVNKRPMVDYTHPTPPYIPTIKDIIFSKPATIVLWKDGTKSVVKCTEGDVFDPEKGLMLAIIKKLMGNKNNYYKFIKKHCEIATQKEIDKNSKIEILEDKDVD